MSKVERSTFRTVILFARTSFLVFARVNGETLSSLQHWLSFAPAGNTRTFLTILGETRNIYGTRKIDAKIVIEGGWLKSLDFVILEKLGKLYRNYEKIIRIKTR